MLHLKAVLNFSATPFKTTVTQNNNAIGIIVHD